MMGQMKVYVSMHVNMMALLCFDHRDYQTALEDQKRRQQMAVDDAERSHAKHSKFLNQTMEKYNTDIIALKISTKYAYILVYQFLIIC